MKKILSLFIVLVVMFSLSVPVTAAAESTPVPPIEDVEYQTITPFLEFTTTFTRITNGVLEYRIWSNTFLRWNTPWRPVFP
ncbi:MAG: hypothetical protein FWC13_12495 [Oscillospiraceae bacterium]|nr:hypothetical protein [Oscillospiraceae bacterium]